METSGPKGRWKSETDQDEKGETRRRIYNRNGPGFRGARCRGRMRMGSGIGPVKRGIHQWRDMVLHPGKGECRVCRVGARIP